MFVVVLRSTCMRSTTTNHCHTDSLFLFLFFFPFFCSSPTVRRSFLLPSPREKLREEQLFIDTMLTINKDAFRLQQEEGADIG